MSRQVRADAGGKPWCVQLELVTGCSMKFGKGPGGLCAFCGLTAIRKGPGEYQYVSMETVDRVTQQVAEFCPNARIEFAMRGEPLMHPKAADIIRMFRKRLPKGSIMLTTNGDTLRGHMKERVIKLFDAGLNMLLMDAYLPEDRAQALKDEAFRLDADIAQVVDFFRDWAGDGKSPYSRQNYMSRTIVLMDDLEKMNGVHSSRQVKTHAGSNMTSDYSTGFPMKRNCGRPFRELVIHSDGNVPLCCDDWKQEFVIANVHEQTLEEIWTSPRFEAARARLFAKDRGFGPCRECDAPMASRTGLLPEYDVPTDEQRQLTEVAFIPKEALWRK